MSVQAFCDWLAATWLSQTFANAAWFVPTVQSVHIVCIAVVLATLVRLDMRLLQLGRQGASKGPSLSQLAGSYLPWAWWSLLVLLLTGTLLTITEPARELMNWTFRLKMLLVAILAILTLILQKAMTRDPGYWSASVERRRLAGALGGVSALLCFGIIACGRLIAYV
jgi:hypothetical protein